MRRVFAMLLAIVMVMSLGAAAYADSGESGSYMDELVQTLGQYIDGEEMFDYLSYVYMGWRTTGGRWQNQVIDSFVTARLEEAGYTMAGAGSAPYGEKSENDMSAASDDDYAWVTYFDVDSLTWDPEYARLTLSAEGADPTLLEQASVESYGFNPTTDTYLDHYGVSSIDEMWAWITEKDENGVRVNVENGAEAELNQRSHLASNSCFTAPAGTDPAEAAAVTGELVYVGEVARAEDGTYTASEAEDLSALAGKALLSDSSLRNTFALAQQVGAVAVMSLYSLDEYSTPMDDEGNIEEPFYHSARFAGGAGLADTLAQTESGSPIVEWQLSHAQYDAMRALLDQADGPVTAESVSVGSVYAMNDETCGGKGQAIAVAEIAGSEYPDERVFICAHVQEPGSNDNATGVGALLGLACQYKRMIDEGAIQRPKRTITFMWGDEMNMATYYLDSHPDEKDGIVTALDMDMVGEDPEKTGGVMRIEKTPDPSAAFNYTLDTLPWTGEAAYDETFADAAGEFVRLPDSHTLWGAGEVGPDMFQTGFFVNDLYMYATQSVIANHDSGFQVDVCPYEGGSDHSRFLAQGVPAMLTWHFTDYSYHTSVDTLAMSSARELENVGLTTLATALMIADTDDGAEDVALELLTSVYDAALARFEIEEQNTANHRVYAEANGDYAAALVNETEVLTAWGEWYRQALTSVEQWLLTEPSGDYIAQREAYEAGVNDATARALVNAAELLAP